jgi:glucan 1,3-beta-glucosidase
LLPPNNVATIVSTGLAGPGAGASTTPGWRQGPQFSASGALDPAPNGAVPLTRADAPLPRRARPTFDDDASPPVSALAYGAVGDGKTDCAAALRAALATGRTVFLPYGYYLISSTVVVPPNGALVGELGSVLLADAASPAFASAAAPAPLLSVPAASTGVRLVDLLFSSTGDALGLVFLDWRATAAARRQSSPTR